MSKNEQIRARLDGIQSDRTGDFLWRISHQEEHVATNFSENKTTAYLQWIIYSLEPKWPQVFEIDNLQTKYLQKRSPRFTERQQHRLRVDVRYISICITLET